MSCVYQQNYDAVFITPQNANIHFFVLVCNGFGVLVFKIEVVQIVRLFKFLFRQDYLIEFTDGIYTAENCEYIQINDSGTPIIDCIKDNTKDYTDQYSKEKFNGYGFGPNTRKMCGFPHFENVEFDGEFPIANISFNETKITKEVKITYEKS